MKGVFIDTISELTDEIQRDASAESVFDLLRLAFYTDPFLGDDPRPECLMCTLCANIIDNEKVTQDQIIALFAHWFRLVSLNPGHRARLRQCLSNS
jgi:hypothetical protein